MHEPGLAGCRADARIALHALHQQFEVTDRQVQIHVELAQVVEVFEAYLIEPGIEGLDDARTDSPMATIGAAHDAQIGQPLGVFLQNGRGLIARSVIDDDPECRRHRLRRDAVERAAKILGLVATWGHEQVASRGTGGLRDRRLGSRSNSRSKGPAMCFILVTATSVCRFRSTLFPFGTKPAWNLSARWMFSRDRAGPPPSAAYGRARRR